MKFSVLHNNSIRIILVLILTLISQSYLILKARSLGGIDLKSMKVAELSDEQFLNYIKQA
jgi:hypothetical protein